MLFTLNRPGTGIVPDPSPPGSPACFCWGHAPVPQGPDEPAPGIEDSVRDLAAEVLRKAGDGDLGDWTRSIVDRALERAGETARRRPFPDRPGRPPPASGRTSCAVPRGGTGERG